MNPLIELLSYGQSFWYDNIRRSLLLDGTIIRLIEVDGLRGMTSNPSIFEKAIGAGSDYDDQIVDLVATGASNETIYENLALKDIQMACDLFSTLYAESNGADGFVSLEVSPHLAHSEEQTVSEARRLFALVNKPNVMIKVPATNEGVAAVRQLISEGINVNVTLMFSMAHYEAVAQAYIDGISQLVESGGDPSRVSSVASFFISRVDTAVDERLSALGDLAAVAMMGKAAIANSKLVYKRYKTLFRGEAFAVGRRAGAQPQRLLWASTSTKNPDYPDTMYVDELIGPETVNTMPPNTIQAFRDHGQLSNSLEDGLDDATKTLDDLGKIGIDLDDETDQLQMVGVTAFAKSYDGLLGTLSAKIATIKSAG